MNIRRRQRFRRNDTGEAVDLTDAAAAAAGSKVDYVCKSCEVRLLEYTQPKNDVPFTEKSYICPSCGRIVDSSLTKMRKDSKIAPDPGDPFFFVNDVHNRAQ